MSQLKIIFILVLMCLLSISSFGQVGINTTTPLSTLDINGNLSVKVVSLNGGPAFGATLINDGVYINLTPTPGNLQFYLNDPATTPGRVYILRNITDFETVELYTAGGKRFFNKTTKVGSAVNGPIFLPPNSVGKSIIIVSDGINWTYFD
ncbi:MAG: hypothetical protein KDC50_03460 [Flavobacterium sp.]|uniref:hypothetical protein n=1 Tax=Flavobacterium sp. TaxID=239 RepID=UPI001D74E0AA|nr:hypothetical protein [Flavobacterium sp.]